MTVKPHHSNFVMTGASICTSPKIDIIGVKFNSKLTFEDHVHGIVSHILERIYISSLLNCVLVDTSVLLRCYIYICAPNP